VNILACFLDLDQCVWPGNSPSSHLKARKRMPVFLLSAFYCCRICTKTYMLRESVQPLCSYHRRTDKAIWALSSDAHARKKIKQIPRTQLQVECSMPMADIINGRPLFHILWPGIFLLVTTCTPDWGPPSLLPTVHSGLFPLQQSSQSLKLTTHLQ
jgi:hypothetical protein